MREVYWFWLCPQQSDCCLCPAVGLLSTVLISTWDHRKHHMKKGWSLFPHDPVCQAPLRMCAYGEVEHSRESAWRCGRAVLGGLPCLQPHSGWLYEATLALLPFSKAWHCCGWSAPTSKPVKPRECCTVQQELRSLLVQSSFRHTPLCGVYSRKPQKL